MAEQRMRSIWYFVGIMLTAMGAVVLLSGIYYIIYPGSAHTVLAGLHPSLWWGGIMTAAGLIYFFANRK
ncbi:MAG: hypothetical protein ACM3Q4_00090 [Acidobacteriota bacterium]